MTSLTLIECLAHRLDAANFVGVQDLVDALDKEVEAFVEEVRRFLRLWLERYVNCML